MTIESRLAELAADAMAVVNHAAEQFRVNNSPEWTFDL